MTEKEEYNWDDDYQGDYIDCPDCDGEMEWCDCCKMYTQICCVDYGTCQCS